MGVAADQLKKVGSFKIAGALNLKLKSKPAYPRERASTHSRKSLASSRPSRHRRL